MKFSLSSILVLVSLTAAAEVTVPHQFASGDKARASDVNANFDAIADGVNANEQRISQIQEAIDALQTELDTLKEDLSDNPGNDFDDLPTTPELTNEHQVIVIDEDESLATTTVGALRNVVESNGTGNNISVNDGTNSIDPLVHGSTIAGGGYGYVGNFIGVGENYPPGQANVAVISGGYDNINDQLAGTIAGGAHHVLDAAGNHGTISGGSRHSIFTGHYSVIGGGTLNSVEGNKSTISGGAENIINSHYSVIAGGTRNEARGVGSAINGGDYNTTGTNASYSTILGGVNVELTGKHAAAFGAGVVANSPGAFTFSGRVNAEAGDAQAVQLHLSNVTLNNSAVYLAATDSSTYPRIPDNTAWAGEATILAKDVSTGKVSAWQLPIVAGVNDSTGWVVKGLNPDKVTLVDQIGLNSNDLGLQINGATGDFRLLVRGLPATEVHWGAYIAVTQIR